MTGEPQSEAFRSALLRCGHLLPLGADGVYGHGATFEAIVDGVQKAITDIGSDQRATGIRVPPVYPVADFDRTGYPASFPHLGGVVFTFFRDRDCGQFGAVAGSAEGWEGSLWPSDLVNVPAACHPVYALYRGAEVAEGRVFDVLGQCFRREPSQDPFRMQAFRQREYVYLGDAAGALAHRDLWMVRSLELLRDLGLAASSAPASDPFFGRGGRLLAANQLAARAKTEMVVPLPVPARDGEQPSVAVVSCNYHGDHFGVAFNIDGRDGPAHTSCVGFGLERLTLALLAAHGLDPARWPVSVREALHL